MSSAGHTVESPADVVAWAGVVGRGVVLLTLEAEQDWELLQRLRDHAPALAVIALTTEESTVLGVRAVRAGARSVLPRQVTAQALRRTVEATSDGQAVVPAEVVTALASGTAGTDARPREAGPPVVDPERMSWLRQLADGSTVAQLAGRVGYSERAMFRMLQALYKEMGVRTRIQAIVLAQEQGWLRTGNHDSGTARRDGTWPPH